MTANSTTLYSIGHSNVPVRAFVARLEQHGIRTVCDVRSTPYSRYNPQFNREAIAESLRDAGIVYRFMGDALGGMPADSALRTNDGTHADYAKIVESAAFVRGIETLIALGTQAPTVFMCGEADYHACHRHRLLTPALIERGSVVFHITGEGNLERGEIEPQQLRMF